MKENGKMILKMDMGYSQIKTEFFLKVKLKMIKKKELEYIFILIYVDMKANIKIIIEMDMGYFMIILDLSIKANGKIIKKKALEYYII